MMEERRFKGLRIIFEDKNILVLDKPSGIVVNRSETTKKEATLQDMVATYLGLKKNERGIGDRAGIVHRLDRETSGVILVAKDQESFENLQRQFVQREVFKNYLALCHGDFREDRGVIEVPVGRHPLKRTKFVVTKEGKIAQTEYEVLSRFRMPSEKLRKLDLKTNQPFSINYSPFTLLSLYPKTGRTHQIRVHLKSIQRPIVSDLKYSGRKFLRLDLKWCKRLFLHAKKIRFKHPKTGKVLEFESGLPSDLKEALELLKEK